MRRGRSFLYLIFILVLLGILGFVVWYQFLRGPSGAGTPQATSTPEVPQVMVVFAKQQIEENGKITLEQLDLLPVSEDVAVSSNLFRSLEEVVDRQARIAIKQGELVMPSMLYTEGEAIEGKTSAWAAQIPAGKVAIPIPVDSLSSVAYGVRDGDRVDILVSLEFIDLDVEFQSELPNAVTVALGPNPNPDGAPIPLSATIEGGIRGRAEIDQVLGQTLYIVPSGPQLPRQVAQSLIQDVRVLHVGEFPLEDEQPTPTPAATPQPADPNQQQPQVTQEPLKPEMITLIVDPQQAVTLYYLINSGADMTLVLRSPDDSLRIETESVTLQFLLDQYKIRIPVKLPVGLSPEVEQPAP